MLFDLHVPSVSLIFFWPTVETGSVINILQVLHPRPPHLFAFPLFVPKACFLRLFKWHLIFGPTFFTNLNKGPGLVRKLCVCFKVSPLSLTVETISSSAWNVDATIIFPSNFSGSLYCSFGWYLLLSSELYFQTNYINFNVKLWQLLYFLCRCAVTNKTRSQS